jgi:hypothetical protein
MAKAMSFFVSDFWYMVDTSTAGEHDCPYLQFLDPSSKHVVLSFFIDFQGYFLSTRSSSQHIIIKRVFK